MSACIDARIDMRDVGPLLEEKNNRQAVEFAAMMKRRVANGVGGEVRVEWPEGPAWLRERLGVRYALGGTGPQAAWVLSQLGAPTLIALEDRYEQMLRQVPSDVLIGQGGVAVRAADVVPTGQRMPEIFIFEYTAGTAVGDVVPKRSSRIIVRFHDRGIQKDRDFVEVSKKLAPTAAAGLLSGLNDEPEENVEAASKAVFDLGRAWKSAGLKTIHLELAGYVTPDAMRAVLDLSRGAVTSIGMSHSELLAMDPSAEQPMDALLALGERLQLDRVCVHADTWAASATRGDPGKELNALMAGCAIAAARAAAGSPVSEVRTDPAARFENMPFASFSQRGDWSFVACPAPYLDRPTTTLGLGDSFTAGCLLVLGREARSSVHGFQGSSL
jgi:ADP-dependent phosphofructokinase/glucokinase